MEPREAFITQFRDDFVPEFEFRKSLLRRTCTTEWVSQGRDARFLIAGGKGIETVTRGPNGRIPGRPPNNRTETVTLSEEHDVAEETGFDIFVAQGRQADIMQYSTIGVMNRRYDTQILEALGKATRSTGAAQTGGLDLALHAKTILGVSEVDNDGMLTAVITPAFEAFLLKEDSFRSSDFVTFAPLDGSDPKESGYGYYRWAGVNWIVHPRLPGVNTADERCFMYQVCHWARLRFREHEDRDGLQLPS